MIWSYFKQLLQYKQTYFLLGSIVILIYLSPFIIHGKSTYVVQYDSLDSIIPWYKILIESGMAFSKNSDIIPNMMNGLPRVSYPGEFSFIFILYSIFEPFTAYIINEFFIHVIAFLGMFLLVNKYIFTSSKSGWQYFYIFVPTITFALLPFWTHGGLSVAGQPIVLYAFLNFRHNNYSLKDWLILIVIPFYSSLILSFIFFLFTMGMLWVYDFLTKKKINWSFLSALVLMSGMYLLVEYRLVYEMFIQNSFISHRIEFDLRHNFTFDNFYRLAHTRFLNGSDNNITLQYKFILPFIIVNMLLLVIKKRLEVKESLLLLIIIFTLYLFDGWHWLLASVYTLPILLLTSLVIYLVSNKKIIPMLIIIQICIAYWAEFWQSPWWNQFSETFSLIKSFHFSRFIFISVPIWYLLFALSIKEFVQKVRFSFLWLIPLVILQLNLADKWKTFGTSEWGGKKSYEKYYATKLFDNIYTYIGKEKDTYRIISLGLEPAVTLFNGFYTLDGYSTNYPIEYKHQFGYIIKKHLSSMPPHMGNNKVYNDWGSKVYLLQSGIISIGPDENRVRVATDFDFDVRMLYCIGANYIFSAYEIQNPEILGLEKIKTFNDPDKSIWTITVYSIRADFISPMMCAEPSFLSLLAEGGSTLFDTW